MIEENSAKNHNHLIEQRHQEACRNNQDYYEDPFTQEMIFTEAYLANRGWCCNQTCRHCPYEGECTPNITVRYKNA